MWDLPRPGLEPVSPALAGRFSTTAPPGKPTLGDFNIIWMVIKLALTDHEFFLLTFLEISFLCWVFMGSALELQYPSLSGFCLCLGFKHSFWNVRAEHGFIYFFPSLPLWQPSSKAFGIEQSHCWSMEGRDKGVASKTPMGFTSIIEVSFRSRVTHRVQ